MYCTETFGEKIFELDDEPLLPHPELLLLLPHPELLLLLPHPELLLLLLLLPHPELPDDV